MEMSASQFAGWCDKKAAELGKLDLTPALDQIRDELTAAMLAGFEGSHDPDGRPWLPLADSFAKPLVGKSGEMIARVLAAHRAARLTPTSMLIEVDSEIAGLHNVGRKKRPQREFLGFGDKGLERAAEIVTERVSEMIVKD